MVLARRRSKLMMRTFDWTRQSRPARDFERSTRENVDWTSSPLGPIEQWPPALRQMVLVAMADIIPSAIVYRGTSDQSAIVYNEAFAELIGTRHPNLQGGFVKNALADVCPDFDVTWEQQSQDGRVKVLENQRVRQDRLGFVEEKSYSWKLLPLVGEDESIVGSLVTCSADEENKTLARRERSKSAVRGIGNVVRTAIDRTASQTAANILKLDEHFSGRTCNCAKLWELQVKEERIDKFANQAPVGIIELRDDDGYAVESANLAFWDITAQSPDAKSFLDCIHPDDVDKVRGHLGLGSFRQPTFSFQCRLKRWAARSAVSPSEAVPEAMPAWILVSAFKDPKYQDYLMCWIIDITSHKSAEAFLRRRMQEAVEMKQQKETFIDQISHEIRNPLSAMTHCADDIISNIRSSGDGDQSSADVLEAAQTIAFCIHHIKQIVDDVLTLSKLDSRLVEISPSSSRPRATIERAIAIFQRELKASRIELTFEEDSSTQAFKIDWILLDPKRYLQVFLNMMTNAIKVVKGQPIPMRKITVRLSAAKDNTTAPAPATATATATDDRLMVQFVKPRHDPKPVDFGEQFASSQSFYLVTTVEDTGPGLSTNEVESLFERFAQANPKTESKYGGSGLGLFISRDLAELQGGRIGLGSEAGVGSKFVFSVETKRCDPPKLMPEAPPVLQLIPPRLQQSENEYSPVLTTAEPENLPENEQRKGTRGARKVLVVEDNLINQRVLANQLRKRGYEVDVAMNGEEALKKLHISLTPPDLPFSIPRKAVAAFDVVLLDIEMPVMDGISCVQQIRAFETARKSRSRLPAIAVTANARSEHGTAALDAGMDAITTKPYKIEHLVLQIENACRSAD